MEREQNKKGVARRWVESNKEERTKEGAPRLLVGGGGGEEAGDGGGEGERAGGLGVGGQLEQGLGGSALRASGWVGVGGGWVGQVGGWLRSCPHPPTLQTTHQPADAGLPARPSALCSDAPGACQTRRPAHPRCWPGIEWGQRGSMRAPPRRRSHAMRAPRPRRAAAHPPARKRGQGGVGVGARSGGGCEEWGWGEGRGAVTSNGAMGCPPGHHAHAGGAKFAHTHTHPTHTPTPT